MQKHRQISNAHKLSVSSFDEQASKRTSTSEAFQAPEHEGWLHKQSDKYKTWNKRWFVLKGSNLFYFKSPKVSFTDTQKYYSVTQISYVYYIGCTYERHY
jgi:hypothetical protein